MKFTAALLATYLVLFFGAAAMADKAPAATPAAEDFVLTVKFQTPITSAEIKIPITLGESFFKKAEEPKDGFTSVSGTVLPGADGNYTLYLTSIEWASSHANTMGAGKSTLKLDEPQTSGMISSVAFTRTIMLTRAKGGAK